MCRVSIAKAFSALFLVCCLNVFNFSVAAAQQLSEDIRLNQVGFYPNADKIVIVTGANEGEFYLTTAEGQKKVYSGNLGPAVKSLFSDKQARVADFSDFRKAGKYVLVVPGVGASYPFEIAKNVYEKAADAVLKGYYYQRASAALPEKYAGKWQRTEGHPDDHVKIHSSAASVSRPEGTIFASSKGWYDAGDYGKYIVNSGITMGTLFSLYEDYPSYFEKHKDINIPESGNEVPDLLDEASWNLRWMLTMQDPGDGGVYHKMTTAQFEGMVMPDKATKQRYFIKKSVTASLDFAAVMAQASRIYRKYDQQFPGLADSCVQMAEKAWAWAEKNPDELYDQDRLNNEFDPDVTTGAYGDRNASDEFSWAAAELFVTTGNAKYFEQVTVASPGDMDVPSWGDVQLLGYYSLLRFKDRLPAYASDKIKQIETNFKTFAKRLSEGRDENIYQTVIGKTKRDFIWGSNAVAANQAVALIQAYRLTKEKEYLRDALANLDYLLGRNGTGYSFVTGVGSKSPMSPHHRPSEADGINEPVPGLLVGGPNPGQQDHCRYESNVPDESYSDSVCSYASNEIAINWNAPMVYLLYAIENLQRDF